MSKRSDVDLNHLELSRYIRVRELSAESEAGVVDEDLDRNALDA